MGEARRDPLWLSDPWAQPSQRDPAQCGEEAVEAGKDGFDLVESVARSLRSFVIRQGGGKMRQTGLIKFRMSDPAALQLQRTQGPWKASELCEAFPHLVQSASDSSGGTWIVAVEDPELAAEAGAADADANNEPRQAAPSEASSTEPIEPPENITESPTPQVTPVDPADIDEPEPAHHSSEASPIPLPSPLPPSPLQGPKLRKSLSAPELRTSILGMNTDDEPGQGMEVANSRPSGPFGQMAAAGLTLPASEALTGASVSAPAPTESTAGGLVPGTAPVAASAPAAEVTAAAPPHPTVPFGFNMVPAPPWAFRPIHPGMMPMMHLQMMQQQMFQARPGMPQMQFPWRPMANGDTAPMSPMPFPPQYQVKSPPPHPASLPTGRVNQASAQSLVEHLRDYIVSKGGRITVAELQAFFGANPSHVSVAESCGLLKVSDLCGRFPTMLRFEEAAGVDGGGYIEAGARASAPPPVSKKQETEAEKFARLAEQVRRHVVTRKGSQIRKKALNKYCRNHCADCIRQVETLVKAFPETFYHCTVHTGKKKKNASPGIWVSATPIKANGIVPPEQAASVSQARSAAATARFAKKEILAEHVRRYILQLGGKISKEKLGIFWATSDGREAIAKAGRGALKASAFVSSFPNLFRSVPGPNGKKMICTVNAPKANIEHHDVGDTADNEEPEGEAMVGNDDDDDLDEDNDGVDYEDSESISEGEDDEGDEVDEDEDSEEGSAEEDEADDPWTKADPWGGRGVPQRPSSSASTSASSSSAEAGAAAATAASSSSSSSSPSTSSAAATAASTLASAGLSAIPEENDPWAYQDPWGGSLHDVLSAKAAAAKAAGPDKPEEPLAASSAKSEENPNTTWAADEWSAAASGDWSGWSGAVEDHSHWDWTGWSETGKEEVWQENAAITAAGTASEKEKDVDPWVYRDPWGGSVPDVSRSRDTAAAPAQAATSAATPSPASAPGATNQSDDKEAQPHDPWEYRDPWGGRGAPRQQNPSSSSAASADSQQTVPGPSSQTRSWDQSWGRSHWSSDKDSRWEWTDPASGARSASKTISPAPTQEETDPWIHGDPWGGRQPVAATPICQTGTTTAATSRAAEEADSSSANASSSWAYSPSWRDSEEWGSRPGWEKDSSRQALHGQPPGVLSVAVEYAKTLSDDDLIKAADQLREEIWLRRRRAADWS